ncbi:neuroblastoma breakpoint family member 11-like [Octodon degus]|uniref:Neuroblastoma breakpoint family member 11-like n=1 Tax=Octodon degus TaxID=10160 RepID=A0A6P6DXD2_OCTDE|nr:neuroblastoma breakpoint family member 11-like [Octodon degus]
MPDLDEDFEFLIEDQAKELTKLRQKLEEGRDTASTLHQNLSSLLAEDDQHRCQMENHRHILADGCRLAKCLAHTLSPDNLHNVDEDDKMILDSSLWEQEENELGPDSLDENYFLPTCLPDEPEPDECTSIVTFPSQKPEDRSVLDGSSEY